MKNILIRKILKNKFIAFTISVFIVKIILAILFSSDYQNEMFIPFVDTFCKNIGSTDWNVYQYYFSHGLVQSFPYPPLMLFIEIIGYIPVKVLSFFGCDSCIFSNLLFKIPIFIFDFLGFFVLLKIFPDKKRYVAFLYFASPIVIYSSFMHGQLDIIPTTLLFTSFYKLKRIGGHKYDFSAVLLALAFLTKTHILAVLPLVLLFILHRHGFLQMIRYFLLFFFVSCCGILPFFSKGFVSTVFMNKEQNVLTQFFVEIGTVKVFVPVLAIIIIYLVTCGIRTISDELLIFMCGIVFSFFLSLCQSMPGWFVWIVPFVVVFVASVPYGRYNNTFAYLLLNVFYCFYFIFLHESQYTDLIFLNAPLNFIKLENKFVANVCFTCIVGVLLYLIWQMYSFGISINSLYKRRNEPFTIGITGDSGSGKSYFVETMEKILGKKNLQCLEGDGDHRWERGAKNWNQMTHLNPNANYLYRQAQNLVSMHQGASVRRIDYDHLTGTFTESKKVKVKKFVFLCGLHSLYLPQARENLDLKIYIDTDEKLRRLWKIKRDVKERGQSVEKILESIENRAGDAEKYIHPQKEYADIVVRYFDSFLTDYTDINYEANIGIQITMSSAIDFEPLVNVLEDFGIPSMHEFSKNLEKQSLKIESVDLETRDIPINRIISSLVPSIDEITVENLENLSPIQQILAMIILMFIDNKMQIG